MRKSVIEQVCEETRRAEECFGGFLPKDKAIECEIAKIDQVINYLMMKLDFEVVRDKPAQDINDEILELYKFRAKLEKVN